MSADLAPGVIARDRTAERRGAADERLPADVSGPTGPGSAVA